MMRARRFLLLLLCAACQSTPAPKPQATQPAPAPRSAPSAAARPAVPSPKAAAREKALRDRAQQPGNAVDNHLWRALAAWHLDNRPAVAAEHVARALAIAPTHPRALLLACALPNAQRQYGPFLQACARAVELAPSSPEAVVALAYLDNARGQHPDWAARVGGAAAAALDRCPRAPGDGGACTDVAATALRAGMLAAASTGDAALWQALAGRSGLVTTFKVAGPYAPPEVDAFRSRAGLGKEGIPDSVPPPPTGGGVFHVAPRKLADGLLFPALAGVGGLYVVQTWLHQPRPARVLLEVRSTASVRAYVDGALVASQDAWEEQTPGRLVASLVVVPGWHRIALEMAAQPADHVEIRWLADSGVSPLDQQTADLPAAGRPSPAPTILPNTALAVRALQDAWTRDSVDAELPLSLAAIAMEQQEAWRARAILEEAAGAFPSSARVQQALAVALEDDPTLPSNVRQARARQACTQALKAEPANLVCRYRMAAWDLTTRPDDGLDALRAVAQQRADYPHVWRSLFEAYRARGWNVEARQALEKGLALGSVDLLAAPGAGFLTSLGHHARARALEELGNRNVDSPWTARRAQYLAEHLEDAAALKEWDRLLAQSPDHPLQSERITVLQRGNDPRAARDALEKYVARFPSDGDMLLRLCTVQWTAGDLKAAAACVARVRASFPALAQVERVTLGNNALEPGEDPGLPPANVHALLQELAAQRQEDAAWLKGQPTVVLLDHGRTVLRRDGSTLHVKHRIIQVGTKEAADELGEIQLGTNEERRLLRVVTADGRVVEPELGQGKSAVSLSLLGPGDTLELRTVTLGDNAPPLNVFQEHFFLADRFPTLRGEYVLDVPKDLMDDLAMTSLGVAAPNVAHVGDTVRHVWTAQRTPAIRQEPNAAWAGEHVPNVGVVLHPSPSLDALRVCRAVAGTAQVTPETRHAAALIRPLAGNPRAALGAALDLVNQHVEPEMRPWNAGEALASGRGFHLAVVRALLRQAGIPARVVLAASVVSPLSPLQGPFRREVMLLVVPTPEGDVVLAQVGPQLLQGPFPPVLVAGSGMEADCDELARLGQPYELPLPQADAWESTAQANLTIQPQGLVEGSVVMRVEESGAYALRKDVAQATPEQLAQWLGGVFQPWLAGVELTGLETSSLAQHSGPLELRVGVVSSAAVQARGNTFVWEGVLQRPLLKGVVGGLGPEDYLRAGTRTTPLLVSRVLHEKAQVRIQLPPGAQLVQPPRDFDVAAQGFQVTQRVSVKGETVTIQRTTRVDPVRVAPADFPQWRAQVEKVLQEGSNRLEWTVAPPPTNNRGRARP